MIGWILQHPWKLALGGGALTAATAFIAGRLPEYPKLRRIPIVTAIITLLLVGLSLAVETEEERIARIIHDAADAIEGGNYDALASYIHPRKEGLRRIMRYQLRRYRIHSVSVKSNLRVKIERDSRPQRAIATFNVVVEGSDPDAMGGTRNVPRYVVLYFEKVGDDWKAVDLQHFEPTASMRTEEYRREHGIPSLE